jgi:beta-phosphoglucomutase
VDLAKRHSALMNAAIDAVLLDFNGTLSRDEDLLADCYEELIVGEGVAFDRGRYFRDLAGGSDTEIFGAWLGREHPALAELTAHRVARYLKLARDGHTVGREARAAVRELSRYVPVAIVSSAYWVEIETVLTGAGLTNHVNAVVSIEDVRRPKPDPACYLLGLQRLRLPSGARAIAVEDSAVGIAAAKGAGLQCVAVRGTMPPSRLRHADRVVAELSLDLASELLRGAAPLGGSAGHDQRAAASSTLESNGSTSAATRAPIGR